MSENAGWNPNWWKELKEQSLERKARVVEKPAAAAPGDSFLVVTEGTVTEPMYFLLLLEELELSRVWVRVLPGDHSDPRHVIYTAARLATEQRRLAKKKRLSIGEPGHFDHVWAVIDTDVAVRNSIWNDVRQLASARKVKLAHSTPCFEFWLLLHVTGFTTRTNLVDGDAAKRAVRHALGRGYATSEQVAREAMSTLIRKWPEAASHAAKVRRHHSAAATAQPANPSTEVDLLVRALNDSALEHLGKPIP